MIIQTAKLFIITVFVLIPCIAFALPGKHDPLRGGLNYQCSHCHTAPKTLGKKESQYSNNWCLSCHVSGNPDTKNQFSANDYSNIYKTGTVPQSSPMQTSHKWFGTSNVRAAGTSAITIDNRGEAGLNRVVFVGALACTRCHSVHGNSGEASVGPGVLRMANDSSQLCTACHTYYNSADHKLGSHPINVSYTSARNASILANDPLKTTYRTTPVTNAVNPTGEVKLINGKVTCSTCHGIHNTDSRTSTFDPYSSNHVYGQLSSSKGYLLRVSAFGKTADDVNICTNCHLSRNHNVKLSKIKPSVQCNDCHSGHVEYDAADLNGTPNVNLVRRYLQYTTAGRVSKRILYRSDLTKEYWNTTKTGVCQACHTPPQNHYSTPANYPNGVFVPSGGYSGCIGCHNHAEPSGAFSYGTGGSCSNSCHGLPPTTNLEGGTTGRVIGYTRFSEGNTPHSAHAAGGGANVNDFDCNECHQGYTMPKDDPNSVVEVFVTPRDLPGLTATYTKATFACNNVYCHSNGNGTWKPAMNPILWSSAKNVIVGAPGECQSCHDDPNFSGSHTKHLAFGYGCETCHASTVANNTTLLASAKMVGGTHTNKIKEVAYSGVGAAVGSTCANIACHSNGFGSAPLITPSWGVPSSGACGACHKTKLIGSLSTGSHSQHFSFMAGTEQQVCVKCHTTYTGEVNSTHVNGVMNTGPAGCAVCHASPYSTASSTPPWGSISTGCGQCHTTVGAFTGNGQSPNTGGHTKHMLIPSISCNTCHAGAIAGISGGATHADANVDVTSVGYPAVVTKHTAGSGYSTCSSAGAAGCHVNPYSTAPVPTPTWGLVTGCSSCHTLTGAFTGTGNSPTTGGHSKHIAKSPLCSNCHAGAAAGTSGGNFHIDGNVDVAVTIGYAANVTKHTAGSGYSTCSSAGAFACHASPYSTSAAVLAPTWGSSAGCVSCHSLVGAFTGSGSSPNTGSHTKHMVASAVCGNCHAGAVAGSSGGNFHSDGNIDVSGGYTANVTKHTQGTYAGSCNTTICHGSSSPTWGANTSNAYCTRCHGTGTVTITTANSYVIAPSDPVGVGTGKVSANAKTGAHETHLRYLNGFSNYSTIDYRCEACHGTLPSANTYTHADGVSSPQTAPVGSRFSKLATNWGTRTPTYTGTTCANTYCHNPAGTGGTLLAGNAGTSTSPLWTEATYVGDIRKTAANCNKCHKSPNDIAGNNLLTGIDHAALTISSPCTVCHGHEGDSSGTEIGKRHMDGIKFGSGTDCNACHGYPPMSAAQLAARGGTYTGGALEKYAGGGGHHISHLPPTLVIADGFTPCLPCHPSVGHQSRTLGIRANILVMNPTSNEANYRFDSSRSVRYDSAAWKCSNVKCHFQPTPVW